MKKLSTIAAVSALGLSVLGTVLVSRAAAQDPILTPIIVSEVEPIVVKALTPKPKPTTTQKFQGTVMHANAVQVTVRAMGDDMGIQTFPLSPGVTAQMQKIIDKGGYQYGDKITVYYDPQSHTAIKLKGKPSRPL